jgi:hypothetical protein
MAQVQRLERRGFRALVIADRRTDCGPSGAAALRRIVLAATGSLPFGDTAPGGAGGSRAGGSGSGGSGSGGSGSGGSEPDSTEAGGVLSAGPTSGGEGRLPSGAAAPWLGPGAGSGGVEAVLVLLVAVAAGGLWLALSSPLWRRAR